MLKTQETINDMLLYSALVEQCKYLAINGILKKIVSKLFVHAIKFGVKQIVQTIKCMATPAAGKLGLTGRGYAVFQPGMLIGRRSPRQRPPRRAPSASAAAPGAALTAGVFAFLLHSATDTNLQSLRLVSLLWFSMGLAMAARRLVRRSAP